MGVDTMGGSAHEGNVISVTLQGLGSFPCLPPPLNPLTLTLCSGTHS